jgi:multiple sugar transport system ATP-binding protein
MARVLMRSLNKKYDEVHAVIDVNLKSTIRNSSCWSARRAAARRRPCAWWRGWKPSPGKHLDRRKVVNDLPPMDRDIAMVFQNMRSILHERPRQHGLLASKCGSSTSLRSPSG